MIGNHDYDVRNKQSMDCITPLDVIFKELGGEQLNIHFHKHTECFVDDNLIFCNYSNYDDNSRPPIEEFISKYPNKTTVGLFHDIVVGSLNHFNIDVSKDNPHVSSSEIFEGCEYVLMGDIHKHQTINYDGGKQAVYSGSLFQLNYGESVTGHGYCLWDVETKSFEFKEVETDYGMYKISINVNDDDLNNSINYTNI